MNHRTMQACVFTTPGPAENVLEARAVPMPAPGAGEVLVRMEASPIQPADLMFVGGRYRVKPQLPQVAGLEGCGLVVRDESDAGFAPGTRVAFRHPACWAEYNVVPAGKLFRVPEGVLPESACQFSLNPVTAWALLHECEARPGDWIAVNAASSSVAALVRVFAKRARVHVVSIYRGNAVDAAGPAVSSDTPDLVAALRLATGGRPLAALLDSIGGAAITRVLPALAPGAVIVSYGLLGAEPATIGNGDLIFRNLTWKGFGIDHWLARNSGLVPSMANALWRDMSERALPLAVHSKHALSSFRDALAAAGEKRGKVLLIPAG